MSTGISGPATPLDLDAGQVTFLVGIGAVEAVKDEVEVKPEPKPEPKLPEKPARKEK